MNRGSRPSRILVNILSSALLLAGSARGEIQSTDGISVNFSGRNSFQALYLLGGLVYADTTIVVKVGDEVLKTITATQRKPHSSFLFKHPVTGRDEPPGAGFFQRHFIDGLPTGRELTITFSGKSAVFLHDEELHDPTQFEFTTTGTLGSVVGDPSGNGINGPIDILWEGGEILLDRERLDIGEGVTLTVRDATVKSTEPDLNLTRADLLINGGNLIGENARFENISEITLSGDGESVPKFKLTDSQIKSETFSTKIRSSEYVLDWDGCFEDHSSNYKVLIPEAGVALPNAGAGEVILQLCGDLTTLDTTTLHARIFDFSGDLIADKSEEEFRFSSRSFKAQIRNLLIDGENRNLPDGLRAKLATSAFNRTETPDHEGIELTITDPPENALIRGCRLPMTEIVLRNESKLISRIENSLLGPVQIGEFPNHFSMDVELIGNEIERVAIYGSFNLIQGNFVRSLRFRDDQETANAVGIQLGPDSNSSDLEQSQANEITGNRVSGFRNGVELRFAGLNVIQDNTVEFNQRNLVFHGQSAGGQNKPLDENVVTNNIFREPRGESGQNFLASGHCADDFCNNSFSGPASAGPNIVGGDTKGGNFWSDYFGVDINGDNIGDTPYIAGDPANGAPYLDQAPLIVAQGELVVNVEGDETDADPNDGIIDVDLATPGTQVTLRAAIEEANAREGVQLITFEPEIIEIEVEDSSIAINDPLEIAGSPGEGGKLKPTIIRNVEGAAIQVSAEGRGSKFSRLHFRNIGFGAVSEPTTLSKAIQRKLLSVEQANEVEINLCNFSSDTGSEAILLSITDGGSCKVLNSKFEGDGFAGIFIDQSPGSQIGETGAGNFFTNVPVSIQGVNSAANRVVGNSFEKEANNISEGGLTILGSPGTIVGEEDTRTSNFFLDVSLKIRGEATRGTVISNNSFSNATQNQTEALLIENAVESVLQKGNEFFSFSPAIRLVGSKTTDTSIKGNEFNGGEPLEDSVAILIEGANKSQIGGTSETDSNIFKDYKVGVGISDGRRNLVRGNQFKGEKPKLRVDLAFDPNNPGARNPNDDDTLPEAASLPNELHNSPEFQLVLPSILALDTVVVATLSNRPNTNHGIDIYTGEGRPTQQNLVSSSDAVRAFTVELTNLTEPFSMNATDENGNTSEDSPPTVVYVVDSKTDLSDSTPGDGFNLTRLGLKTLRAAIEDANALALQDIELSARIHFAIPASGIRLEESPTIQLERDLPTLLCRMEIGTKIPEEISRALRKIGIPEDRIETNPGQVEIDGSQTSQRPGPGFESGNDLTIENLKITGFPEEGILMKRRGSLDLKGSQITGNRGGIILGPENEAIIGGDTTTPGTFPGNVISRNLQLGSRTEEEGGGAGIFVDGSSNFLIQGNLLGISTSGDPSPNLHGIFVKDTNQGNSNRVIRDNVIGENLINGVRISNSSDLRIQGNRIGISQDNRPLGNGSIDPNNGRRRGHGILIESNLSNEEEKGALRTLIGGIRASDKNIISANKLHGIALFGDGVRETTIQGNVIGDPLIPRSIDQGFPGSNFANGETGIFLDQASETKIGGEGPARNEIVANRQGGIFLFGKLESELDLIPITKVEIINNLIAFNDSPGQLGGVTGITVLNGEKNRLSENISFNNSGGQIVNTSDFALDGAPQFGQEPSGIGTILNEKLSVVFDLNETSIDHDARLEFFAGYHRSFGRKTNGWERFLAAFDQTNPAERGAINLENQTHTFELDFSEFGTPDQQKFADLFVSVTQTNEGGTSNELVIPVKFSDIDNDGSEDRREQSAIGDGDLNNNGVPDTNDPSVVALPVFDDLNGNGLILPVLVESVDSPAGVESIEIVRLEAIPTSEALVPLPSEVVTESGLISLNVKLQNPGGSIRVKVGLPENSKVNAIYKLVRKTPGSDLEWVLFEDSKIKPGCAELEITDGEIGDLDLEVNGMIEDPIALVFDPDLPPVNHGPLENDVDGDGLSDEFELTFFGSVTAANPEDDSDGDGTTELEEFNFGTDPLDPKDVLKLNLNRIDSITFEFSFPSKEGRSYQIEKSTNLENFTNFSAAIKGTGNQIVITDLDPHETRTFFRLSVSKTSD